MPRTPRSPGPSGLPPYWTVEDRAGATCLTFAIRGGRWQAVIVALGAALVAAGIALGGWLLAGGGLTVAGVLLVVLVPGGMIAAGAYCLDVALVARTEYVLGSDTLAATRRSIWGTRTRQVARASVTRVTSHYAAPSPSAPQGANGTWTVALAHRGEGRGDGELWVDGVHTSEEAAWLKRTLSQWAGLREAAPAAQTA